MLSIITKATDVLKLDLDGALKTVITCIGDVTTNAETGAKIIGDKLNTCLAKTA